MEHERSPSTRLRSAALPTVAAALVAMLCGCFAGTAKLRVGPTVDFDGKAAVQADLAFGFGYAVDGESGVTGSLGVGAGSRNYLELTDTIEYQWLEKSHGFRAGVRADIGLAGDEATGMWAQFAFLYPLKSSHRYGGHEKGFQHENTSRWSLGFETRFGYLSHEVEEDEIEGAAAVGAAITLEWVGFHRMR